MGKTPITKTQPQDGTRIKRSVLRVIGLSIITSGFYNFYWFFVTKNQLKRELKGDQHVGWQTVGMVVPILQAFILYWLYRDINRVRATEKLPLLPAVWYVVIPLILAALGLIIGIGAFISILGAVGSGLNDQSKAALGLAGAGVVSGLFAVLILLVSGILQYVFLGLAISQLNQYWDKRTGGKAAGAGWGKGEIAVVVIGVLVMIANYSNNGSTKTNYEFKDNPPVTTVTTVLS